MQVAECLLLAPFRGISGRDCWLCLLAGSLAGEDCRMREDSGSKYSRIAASPHASWIGLGWEITSARVLSSLIRSRSAETTRGVVEVKSRVKVGVAMSRRIWPGVELAAAYGLAPDRERRRERVREVPGSPAKHGIVGLPPVTTSWAKCCGRWGLFVGDMGAQDEVAQAWSDGALSAQSRPFSAADVAGRGGGSLLLHTHVSMEVVVMEHPTHAIGCPGGRRSCSCISLSASPRGHDCRLSALDCAAQIADAAAMPPRPFRAVRAGGYDDMAPLIRAYEIDDPFQIIPLLVGWMSYACGCASCCSLGTAHATSLGPKTPVIRPEASQAGAPAR